MKIFVIEYVDSDGNHNNYECRAGCHQEALAKFMAWSEDIGEVLIFVRFVKD